jgi:hypothetical protein
MIDVLLAILGAALVIGSSLALGFLILQRWAVPFTRLEAWLFAFFTGASAFSLLTFLITAAYAAYTLVFLLVAITCIFVWVRLVGPSGPYATADPVPKGWLVLAIVLCARFAVLYISRALGPEYSYDGSTYHLALVATYFREHHFPLITTNMYANFPEGLEMLFLAAFSVGRHAAATTVHLFILFGLSAAFIAFGLRFHMAKAGIAAMVLVFLAPIVGFDASVGYNDVAMAAACFMTFYALQLWAVTENRGLLVAAGFLAGFAGTVKYTGFIAPVYAFGFVLWNSRRSGKELKSRLAFLVIPATALIAPWLVKNWIEVANPLSPFFNRIFHNPYMTVSFEEAYRYGMAHYNKLTLSELPMEVTLHGDRSQGIIGPVFLLAPIIVFALGSPMGRQLVIAFLVFLLPYFSNIGTRFLFPSLPMLALAICFVLQSWRGALLPVVLLQFCVCIPRIVGKYAPAARGPDGLYVVRWDETFRDPSEDAVLRKRLYGYAMARYIDQHLPANARIFQFGGVPGAYMRQKMDEFYEGAQNEKTTYLLWSGAYPDLRPTERHTFQFPAQPLRSIRIEQTAADKEELWTVSEVNLFNGEQRIERAPSWKLTSRPFPWDIQLAFDSNFVTVWKSWEHLAPGMFVQADFGQPITLDRVEVDGQRSQAARMVLKGTDTNGREVMLCDKPTATSIPAPADYRQRVTTEVEKLGYSYLVIDQSQPCYREILNNLGEWRMTLVTKQEGYALFALR